LCVASVAWISELKNTLSLPFYLLSLLWYLRFSSSLRPADFGLRTSKWYWLSLGAFVLALLSKTSTVMLPMVLLACALWQRGRLSRRDLVHTGPHFALALGFGLMSVWFQKYQALAGETLAPSSFAERLIVAGRAVWFYLGKALLPVNLNLMYPRWTVDPQAASAWLPVVLLGVGVLGCWCFRRSWGRHVLFALGCFGLTLFPALGFFDAQFLAKWQVSDHLQYLPLVAPVALAAAAMAWVAARVGRVGPSAPSPSPSSSSSSSSSSSCSSGQIDYEDEDEDEDDYRDDWGAGSAGRWRRRTACHMLAAALLLAVCDLAFQRAQVFRTEESLMRDTLARNPAATDAHNDLGVLLAQRNDFNGALAQFTAAAQGNPRDASVQSNLGQLLGLLGQAQQAEAYLRRALALKPTDADAHVRLAKVLSAQGRNREARGHLQMALRFKETPQTRLELAGLLYQAGEARAAVVQFHRVLRTQPEQPEVLNNLAWLLATCADDLVRNGAEAVRCAEQACRLTEGKQSVFLSTLAAAYAEAGRFSEAITTAEMALRQQTAAGETRLAALNQQLLTYYYRAGKPYRERPVTAQVQEAGL
jgi:protein O-mannosyl-transferase